MNDFLSDSMAVSHIFKEDKIILRIEKEMIYNKEEVYSFIFEEISHNKIQVQIKG